MLLTIQTTRAPATDLGYLLHKHPDRAQVFKTSFGTAHVFYPRADEACCRAALLLDIDPVGLVRRRRGPGAPPTLAEYVNDRLYAASSFLSVAMNNVFSSALNGRCNERPELVDTPMPLSAELPALPCRGGPELLTRLFEPLGYALTVDRVPLDACFRDWGESRYYAVRLEHETTVQALLQHLYVLIPVLDNEKHYWVGSDEVEKLLTRGETWLPTHPAKDLIARRYLKHQPRLTRDALSRLTADTDEDPDATEAAHDVEEEEIEKPLSLNQQRHGSVISALKVSGARSVLDLGCAEGTLLRDLLAEKQFERIVGVDVAVRCLQRAADRLRLDRMPPMQRKRIELLHGSLIYRDERLRGFDAAAIVEVIEHLDPNRLSAFERVVFEFARPQTIVLTTPNREYNVMWETLPAGGMRHRDHRFEWTRAEFRAWAERTAAAHGYHVRLLAIGPEDAAVGAPTQMAVFEQFPASDESAGNDP